LFNARAGPFHTALDPIFPPFFIADAVIVITDAKLKSARRANLHGTNAGTAARRGTELGESTNRAGVGGVFHGMHRNRTLTDANHDPKTESHSCC
jgi:hypothetical protein